MNNTDAVSYYWFAQYKTLYLVWSVSRSIQWSKGLWKSTGEMTLLDNTMTFTSPHITDSNRKTMGMILYTVTSSKHVFVTSDNLYAAHLYHDDVIKWKQFHVTGLWNSPLTGEFPSQRPVSRSFDIFFDLRALTRGGVKKLRRRWFEIASRSVCVTAILRSTCWDLLIYGQAILLYTTRLSAKCNFNWYL